ncbi:YhcB family protein [Endozoicomonas sp. G2_1]|uniref:YhcB family protein n=1 Tax=Endozoicomonas sp. G2_1 TaxID=2821091 RepID=UPI001ADD0DB2|nr:DUF1043 family protein [Endozoicomonas sp. G2_1]MBO9489580.1 YhcB family protein [Endozoicomonas sp. G2_1]
MEVAIDLVVFLLGALLGFFANHFFAKNQREQKNLAEKVSKTEAELAQYKLDVAEHLDNSTKLLADMNATCQQAMQQMETSTNLLKRATPSSEASESMPFFSRETQEQLAQTVALRHPERHTKKAKDEAITEAPLDYSGNPSGLFDDKKQSVTNAE